MAINWDLYNTRLTIRGTTQRERTINDFQIMKNQKGAESPSCKTVLINDVEKQVFINSTNKRNIKSISPVLNSDSLILGSKVYWKYKYWLLNDLNEDDDVLVDGQIQLCNYTLPFQTNSSQIHNEPCIIVDATRASSTGEDEEKIITIPDTQCVILIQYNEVTKYLVESKRLFIDMNNMSIGEPKVYHISKVNRIKYMDGNNGILEITCDQDQITSADNPSLLIADYISKDPSPIPTPSIDGQCFITNTRKVIYNTSVKLKVGGTKKPFDCIFKNLSGDIVADISPIWKLVELTDKQDGKIHLTYDTQYLTRCYINIDNDIDLIGSEFKLQLSSLNGNYGTFELICQVVSFI